MVMFSGLQQSLDEYGRYASADAEDIDRKIAAIRVAMQVMSILRGVALDDTAVDDALLRSPKEVDRHREWFTIHPQMKKTAFVCDLAEENKLFEATFSGLRGTATKSRISACVAMMQHWEDGELFEWLPVGVNFFAPAGSASIIIAVSKVGNLRTMELRGTLSNTQKRILSKLEGVLGDDEAVRTAGDADKAYVHATLWDALNVAEVNQSFYAGIATRFNELVKTLVDADYDEDGAKMFASRLIGRVLFAWFLNQKGFINPDERYLNIDGLNATDYYERKLKRLFFATLNTAKDRRDADGDMVTPFLNGGLFEEQATDFSDRSIPFPDGFFADLYEHFDQYDFTTDESTPDYEQVAIDPEMLGRIFESLLAEQMDDTGKSARNAQGAFYTPREIVAYMCREALRQYLHRAFDGDDVICTGIDTLLNTPDGQWESESDPRKALWNSNTRTVLPRVLGALEHVRVLDPACGSGAFPMGMLQLLMRCRARLMGKTATADAYRQKLEILRNNVFGADIEPMAVEIARLRVWLSMIVERDSIDQVEPLPNLDFKFVCADSLVPLAAADVRGSEQSNGASIDDASSLNRLNQGAFDLADEDELFDQLKDIRARYFSTTDPERKGDLMQRFETLASQLGGRDESSPRGRQIANFHPHASSVSETGHAPFFDPDFMFGVDVFDVVIGNPPYVQLQKMKAMRTVYESLGYRSYNKTGDLYELFYERGLELLSEHGVLDYITSNKWMRNRYGKELREYFARNAEVISLIDLGAERFNNATVDTNIMLLAKGQSDGVRQAVRYEDNSLTDIGDYVANNAVTIPFNYVDGSSKSDAGKKIPDGSPWVILTDVERSIKHKMEEAGIPLKRLDVRIYRGVLTGLNDAFIISKERRDELIAADPKSAEIIRPVLRGRDIKRYSYEFADCYLVTTHNGYKNDGTEVQRVDVDRYPAIKEWLESFEPKLSKRADQGDTPYNLRDCAYMGDFSQPKIVWGNLCLHAQYAMVKDDAIVCAPSPFIATDDWFLLGVLNSKAADWYVHQVGVTRSGGYMEYKPVFVEQIPIPRDVPDAMRREITELAQRAQEQAQRGTSTMNEEQRINALVYDLFKLGDAEQAAIQQSLG
ncbi:Eco57I restriction-modification methylase domain-containing protein [Bifidobacterium rousetti]|uniref:Eco57I restriction-modification methylase domain-containing protein n=1 Tax=Bifidobacterium rousetti TaxID=2045439 RepID=UPI00168B71F0|nr:Eco57I restriction-modification methylase domain-containing protein [Bifidobacterium rousetti]